MLDYRVAPTRFEGAEMRNRAEPAFEGARLSHQDADIVGHFEVLA